MGWNRGGGVNGHAVIDPLSINSYDFDRIIISLDDLKPGNEIQILQIYEQLRNMDIPDNKIVLQSFKYAALHRHHTPRITFLKNISEMFTEKNVTGSVAECGVYRGWFSGMMSEYFPDRRLYLFDTFSGFDERDIINESDAAKSWLSGGGYDRLKHSSEEMVRLRCLNRQFVTIKQGYVPDTFAEIDERFAFVNLDMDLYAPQLAALRFFGPRMNNGGIILLHDYFSKSLPGTKKAVDEFANEYDFTKFPIGDGLSIALMINVQQHAYKIARRE